MGMSKDEFEQILFDNLTPGQSGMDLYSSLEIIYNDEGRINYLVASSGNRLLLDDMILFDHSLMEICGYQIIQMPEY